MKKKDLFLLTGLSLFFLLGVLFLWVLYFLPLPFSPSFEAHLETTKIYDRHGVLLYEVLPPEGGRKNFLPLSAFPSLFIEGTILLEDASFYRHRGVDLVAVMRAIWLNTRSGKVRSGASTISQQLVRNLLGTTEKRTFQRKAKETVLALRLHHVYSHQQILEFYLNTIYYGNLSYGAETASQSYFGKSLSSLDLSELALLMGIPKSPNRYNPLVHYTEAKKRQEEVLAVLLEAKKITKEQHDQALLTPITFLTKDQQQIKAPHFVHMVLDELTERYGEEAVYRGGFSVVTTFDYGIYEDIQHRIEARLSELTDFDVTNAAVLVVRTDTGEVISLNGSRNYFTNDIQGAVNMVTSYRQPGSTLKPIIYGVGFGQGVTPATVFPDVETRFVTEDGNPYLPKNYDGLYHGPVRVREALANSYNIPAVQALRQVGFSSVFTRAREMGLSFLTESHASLYGLAFALGDAEIRLYDLVEAYRVFARYGVHSDLSFVSKVNEVTVARPSATKLFSPQEAYLITDILSDNDARIPSFGEESYLELSFPAAVKTGTTRNYKDNWTVGYTPEYVVGVWAGNANGAPMKNVSGATGAAPIWHDVMEYLHEGEASDFVRPKGIEEVLICSVSGLLPTEYCEETLPEKFIEGTAPTTYDTVWQEYQGKIQKVYAPNVASWALAHGYPVDTQVTDTSGTFPRILRPYSGDRFRIDAVLPREDQRVHFSGMGKEGNPAPLQWYVGEKLVGEGQTVDWMLEKGAHEIRLQQGEEEVRVNIFVE